MRSRFTGPFMSRGRIHQPRAERMRLNSSSSLVRSFIVARFRPLLDSSRTKPSFMSCLSSRGSSSSFLAASPKALKKDRATFPITSLKDGLLCEGTVIPHPWFEHNKESELQYNHSPCPRRNATCYLPKCWRSCEAHVIWSRAQKVGECPSSNFGAPERR